MAGLVITRSQSAEEVDGVHLAWAAPEGWNPGLHDAAPFYAADPEGWFVGRIDGRPVAAISVVRYDAAFAFFGCYIVDPAYRGQGHGLAITRHAFARVEGCIVGADGALAQLDNYRRIGLELAWWNERRVLEDPASLAADGSTVALDEVSTDELVAYDTAVFPAARPAFLEEWRRMPESVGRAVVDAGVLRGWGLRRRCITGWKIGPLFADNPEIAEALFRDISTGADGPVFLDVPGANAASVALANRFGLPTVFESGRIYRGGPPPLELDRIFGITTLELG
jgi:GNAT superfamily N-acetyltransferase